MTEPAAKEMEINGVRLPYIDQGAGVPLVCVHGAINDLRAWEPLRTLFAAKHRFIAYTQRYFGTGTWPDDGKAYGVATHAQDLAGFISRLGVGPVHVMGWSYGGTVATATVLNAPSLVRSLVLYEPAVVSALDPESPRTKAAMAERTTAGAAAQAAARAGDLDRAVRLMFEAVQQLPPGGFDSLPEMERIMALENARTLPAMLAASPPPAMGPVVLQTIRTPTLILHGNSTTPFFKAVSEAMVAQIPGAKQVVLRNAHHFGPARQPEAFAAIVEEFLARH